MKNRLDLARIVGEQAVDKAIKKVSKKVPTQAFRDLTLERRIQLIGENPDRFVPFLGKRLVTLLQQARTSKIYRPIMDLNKRTGEGIPFLAGVLEGQAISYAIKPFATYFFPGSALPLIGSLIGFDVVTQFFPSPLTNLYLNKQNRRLAPRHQWGEFLWGPCYVIPKGRPTDRQRALDGLLIALNAESPNHLAKYLIAMALVLMAKEMYRRLSGNGDTGRPGDGNPTLGPTLGGGEIIPEPIIPEPIIPDPVIPDDDDDDDPPRLRPLWRRYPPLIRIPIVTGRLAHVECRVCGTEYYCSELHATHFTFAVPWSVHPIFPCPSCTHRLAWAADLVLSPCDVRIVVVPLTMQYFYQQPGFHRRF